MSQIGFLVPENDDVKNYNLIYDVNLEDEDSNDTEQKPRHVFDIVQHWPYGGH